LLKCKKYEIVLRFLFRYKLVLWLQTFIYVSADTFFHEKLYPHVVCCFLCSGPIRNVPSHSLLLLHVGMPANWSDNVDITTNNSILIYLLNCLILWWRHCGSFVYLITNSVTEKNALFFNNNPVSHKNIFM